MIAKGLHGFGRISACLLAGLGMAVSAGGQTAYLVEDLTPGIIDGEASYPSNLVAAGNRLFFVTSPHFPGNNGLGENSALWTSDGTAAGTRQLPDGCSPDCLGTPGFVGVAGSLSFFLTATNEDLPQLWRSDGTVAGTFVLVDALPDFEEPFTVLNDILYFLRFGTGSEQLWRSDGTVAGTTLVADVGPTFTDFGLVAAAGKLFFGAPYGGPDGYEQLWVSDGTPAGTAQLTSFGQTFESPLTGVGGKLLFSTSQSGGTSLQLWATDGSKAGTRLLAPFAALSWFKVEGSSVYFVADDGMHGGQIWVTDGTAAGTRQVTSAPADFRLATSASQFEVVGGTLVFFGAMAEGFTSLWGVSPGSGGSLVPLCPSGCGTLDSSPVLQKSGAHVVFESFDDNHDSSAIWTSDGTASGTVTLKLTCGSSCVSPALTAVGGALYFRVAEAELAELWRTDGTPAGTRQFTRRLIDPGSTPAGFGSKVFFASAMGSSGTELWVSDGTPAGTRQLTDARYPLSSNPTSLTAAGDQVFFGSTSSTPGPPLWRSGGTAATTASVPGSQAYGGGPLLAAFGGVVFVGTSQLWRSDGTAAGTQPLTAPPLAVSAGIPPVAAGGEVFFTAVSADGTTSVWKSDGTPQGTAQAFALPSTVQGIENLVSVGSNLYLVLANGQGGTDLWKSNGTASGTTQLTDFGTESAVVAGEGVVQLGSMVFFVVGNEGLLWQTDGTRAGTSAVPLADIFSVSDLVASGGALSFFAFSSTSSPVFSLYRSDGTPGGTLILQTFTSVDVPQGGGLTPMAGGIAFDADDSVHGIELWFTDGTPAGTRMVRDIRPGQVGSDPNGLTAVGGRLFFSADDGAHGNELWVSDGTAAGTRLVQDINPGPKSSNPSGMTVAGSRLFFAANDGLTGSQLWAFPLAGPGPCQPSATALCLSGGRFKVEAFWQDFQGNSGAGQAVALTGDTGTFWFFSPDNVEVIVKVLDGRALNGSFWVFYGALSNVQYWLTITDTQTGVARRYLNPLGALASVGDTSAFGPHGATSPGDPAAAAAPAIRRSQAVRAAGAAASAAAVARSVPLEDEPAAASAASSRAARPPCRPGRSELCLKGGRFALTARWKDFSGRTGTGMAVPLTEETGYFWFFAADNVETVIKVIDGRSLNGHFWVFFGALSDVQYTLTVTDTVTGAVKTYSNPAGQFASVADTSAF
jgi:ELWxxDGT repeat protein